MKQKLESPSDYIRNLPIDRRDPFSQFRDAIRNNIPSGFEEIISYGMISYVVPHSIYPLGYHCDRKQPLPFISIADKKKHLAMYHMGLYADGGLSKWFHGHYPKDLKLDMGKGCVRFNHQDKIPLKLIAKLASKVSVEKWIAIYESKVRR